VPPTNCISIGNAKKLFGTKWNVYATGENGQDVALPVDTPKVGSGLSGNVNVISLPVRRLAVHRSETFRPSVPLYGFSVTASDETTAAPAPTRTPPPLLTTVHPASVAGRDGCAIVSSIAGRPT
jgi:hypothetical protein